MKVNLRRVLTLAVTLVAAYSASKFLPKLLKYLKIRHAIHQLPHPPLDNPLMGNISQVDPDTRKHSAQFLKMAIDHGAAGSFGFFLGPVPMVLAVGPEVIKVVLGSSKHSVKGVLYYTLWPWLGTGLLTSAGAKWKARRRMITPTFHFDILKRFLEVMNEQTSVLVKRMEEKAQEGPVEAFGLITLCALDIICETAMGKKLNAQLSEGKNDYVEAVYRSSKLVIERPLKPWQLVDWIYALTPEGRENQKVLQILHGFTRQVIKERKALLAEEKAKFGDEGDSEQKTRPAFLDILLSAQNEDGTPLGDEDIREEVDTFMFEGHDTTSASLAWTLQLIGQYPEVQAAVHQEVDAILGDSDEVTYDMLGEFKYLDMVLKESLRVFPSVPFVARELTEDTVINGVTIPAGTNVNIQIYTLHHNPRVWEEPEVFKPERWADDSEERDPYKYIPFSAGPRNCVGQKFAQNEEKVVIAKIMKNFTIKSLSDNVPTLPELILRPEAVKLEIKRRWGDMK